MNFLTITMFITYTQDGKVTAYSDKSRNTLDLKEGEKQVEVDLPFSHIGCKEGGLTFNGEELLNGDTFLAKLKC